MILSDTLFLVRFPSGNLGVYSVSPQHLNEFGGLTLNERALMFGKQIAVKFDDGGDWYTNNPTRKIDDLRTIALLERAPKAWVTK